MSGNEVGLPRIAETEAWPWETAEYEEIHERRNRHEAITFAVRHVGEDAFAYSSTDRSKAREWRDSLRSRGHDVELVAQRSVIRTTTLYGEWHVID